MQSLRACWRDSSDAYLVEEVIRKEIGLESNPCISRKIFFSGLVAQQEHLLALPCSYDAPFGRKGWDGQTDRRLAIKQGGFLVTRRAHGSALHGERCAACCEAHANFADESACLTADVWNEVVTIHRSQEVLKILSSLHVDIFRNCFIKNTGTTLLPAFTTQQTPTFTGWL
jgi:hypothetical protein